jgi:hypothetical protein
VKYYSSSILSFSFIRVLGGILALLPAALYAQTTALSYRPIAAEYSSALDRIIMVSATPDQLHIYNAASQSDVTVNLPKPALSLAVSPDGLHAAVGHDALISYINLGAASVEKTFIISVQAQAITLNASWIYVMPAYEGSSVSVNISTAAVIPNESVFYGSGGRYNAAVNSIYGTRDGISPNDIERYESSTGPITAQTDSIYHGDFNICGPIFFSPDGQRIYDGCNTVFRASTDPTKDMRYVSTFAGSSSIRSLAESATLHRIALIQGSQLFATNPVNDGIVLLYESAFLNPVGQFTLTDFAAGASAFKAHGKWVFYNTASTALYVVMEADSTSGLLNDFAVQTIPLAAPAACGASFSPSSASVIANGALGAVNIAAAQTCQYQALSDSPWLQIVSGGYGSGNGVLTYISRPNSSASSRTGVLSIAGISLVVTQDAASVPSSFNRLAYNVVSAAYDKPLDKMVLVSANPNELHVYDPVTLADQVIPLPAPPLSLSVRPDGLFAAVGHDGWVSYVNLQTAVIVQTFPLAVHVQSLALASNGFIYVWPLSAINATIGSLQISTGTVMAPSNFNFDPLRMTTDGNYLYTAYFGLSKWDITQGVAVPVAQEQFTSINTCGNLWLTEDGNRLFTACAQAYRTSPVASQDLQYNGQLAGLNSLTWADESVIQQSTVVIPSSFSSPSSVDTQLQIFGDAFLGFVGSLPLPQFLIGGQTYAGHGQYVFWNANSTKLFAVEKADSTANLASPFAVSVVAPSTGSNGCTASAQTTVVNVPFGGGFGSVGVTAGPSCVWTATSNTSWIMISGGSFGFGTGTVSISAAVNDTGANRLGTITIAGTVVTVTQALGACTFSLSSAGGPIGFQGIVGTFNVSATGGCGWTASSNVSWLTVTSGGSGIGDGTVHFTAAANPGGIARTGVITVGAQNFTVSESGGPARALAQVAAGSGLTTGFFVLNTSASPAQFAVNFFDDNGNNMALPFGGGPAHTISATIPAQGSAYYETTNPQGALVAGWGQVVADSAIVVHALFRNNTNGAYNEAAVSSAAGAAEVLFPFDSTTFAVNGQPFVTGLAIANLDSTTANIACTARDPDGAAIAGAVPVPSLAPLGHWSNFQFPALAGLRGTIDCVSNTNISATALRFIGSSGTFSSLPVVANPASVGNGGGNHGALAQVAAGAGLTTGFFVMNTGTSAAQFAIQVFDDSGNPAALPFASGPTSALSGTVPAQGLAYYETTNPQGPLVAGWGQINADPSIVIQALFRSSTNGFYHEAAVTSTPGSREFLIPFDAGFFPAKGQSFVTGFAIANVDAASSNIACTAYGAAGSVIANAVPVPALAPLGHWASFQFPALNGQHGTIDCVSTTNTSATALHFLGTTGTVSSLPVVTK